jgi:hypothetical protein
MEANKDPKSNAAKAIVSLIILAIILWFFFGGGEIKVAKNQMQQIENQVADDAVRQYEIAKRQGDKMQTYTQASFVVAAYLQAKDESNYNKWKAIEDSCAKTVGLSQ